MTIESAEQCGLSALSISAATGGVLDAQLGKLK